MKHEKTIYLDGQKLTIEDVINIAENNYVVDFSDETRKKIIELRQKLDKQLEERPDIAIYGTNRLHGDLKDKVVPLELLAQYQVKYMKVHNCGTGEPLPIEIVRAIMVIRLNSFAKNLSGMRMETCQLMIDLLNKQVTPWVLEEGSVGASGDLVPLAMIGAVLIGLPEAKAYYNGELLDCRQALELAGLKPTALGAKEAMGLTNGSNFIAAGAVFAVRDVELLIKNASIAASLSLEAIRGEKNAFLELIHENRPHEGQLKIAGHIRNLIADSKRTTPEAQTQKFPGQGNAGVRVQDRYSFRAVPQVHGPTYEAIKKLREVVTIEINSATDNPLFTTDEKGFLTGISGANFHGQPLAAVIDYVKITLTSLGLISDKRSFSLLDDRLSYGLPADLAYKLKNADGGLMITQYAGAARAAECRVLSTPASVMSLSTSANQEDFVSMGSIGVLHLKKITRNVQVIIGVELLCALRGIQLTKEIDELPKNLRALGKGTSIIFDKLEKVLGPAGEDQYLRTDMEKVIDLVKSGQLVEWVADLFK
ncbi:MAG TPA: aromatic amino acid ammonia-lyase [Candidatus Deferrimicrobium sp.]|nr:aromatic amino acid ammonia-lyase [Candidatus Deferrimicrobium sp.]